MPTYKKWFCEKDVPGKRFQKIKHCFLIDKLIFQGKTPFQKVLIFDNSIYGRIFCLDGIVQFSAKDEFIYHEMISHPVLFSHPKPESVLILGGGDGGVLSQVLKHPVKKIDLVEIDKGIIEISKKYLSFLSQNSFSDKRVKIYYKAGQEFIKNCQGIYDVIIVDCTNYGKGLSEGLYTIKFYKNVFSALKEEGIMITLGASFLDFENFIQPIFQRLKRVFPFVVIYRFCLPSYHCGEYSFLAASKKINLAKVNFQEIKKRFERLKGRKKIHYYSPEIHQASLVLPKIWQMKNEGFNFG